MSKKPSYKELEKRVRELEVAESELKQAVVSLKEREESLRSAYSSIGDAIIIMDTDGSIAQMNSAAEKITGWDAKDAGKKPMSEAFHIVNPETEEEIGDFTQRILNEEKAIGLSSHSMLITKDDKKCYIEHSSAPIKDDKGCLTGAVLIFRDETEEREIREALKESESRFHLAADSVDGLLYVMDTNLRFIFIRGRGLDILDIEQDQLVGTTLYDFYENRNYDNPSIQQHLQALAGETVHYETHRNGITLSTVLSPIKDGRNNIAGIIGLSLNVTKHRQVERALQESQARLNTILEAAQDGIFMIDFDTGRRKYANPAMAKMMGFTNEEILNTRFQDGIGPETVEMFRDIGRKMIRTKQAVHDVEYQVSRKNGSRITVSSTLAPLPNESDRITDVVGIMRDVTDRKRAEEERERLQAQLNQAHKMEAIGTLAGGIAHDFNNILGIILGNTDMAKMDVPNWNPAQENLNEIREACLRARDVTRQILEFSRHTKQDLRPIQIGAVISKALTLIRSTIPTTIEIKENIPQDVGIVLANETQISQILLNLCTNASHAMRDKGGILTIILDHVYLGEEDIKAFPDLAPGDHVKLSVSDTGQGIAADQINRIFDPYFTTKDAGEGTGMGLSVVHGIVKQHNGVITVNSEIGKGATFNILFPIIEDQPGETPDVLEDMPIGNESILFVDDEPAMARIYQVLLERLGYTVSVRTSSIEALEAFKAQPKKYDLIIADQTMPHMTGHMLASEIMAIRPNIPVILCTGHSDVINEKRAKEMGIKAFVMKPIAMGEIAETIRTVMDADND